MFPFFPRFFLSGGQPVARVSATEKSIGQHLLDERALGVGAVWKEAEVTLNVLDTAGAFGEDCDGDEREQRVTTAFAKALK